MKRKSNEKSIIKQEEKKQQKKKIKINEGEEVELKKNKKFILDLAIRVIEDQKNLDLLLNEVKNENLELSHCAITTVAQVFTQLKENEDSSYLDKKLKNFSNILFQLLNSREKKTKLLALDVLLKILKLQSKLLTLKNEKFTFATMYFNKLLEFLFELKDNLDFLDIIVNLLDKFLDLRFYFFSFIKKLNKFPQIVYDIMLKMDPTSEEDFEFTYFIEDKEDEKLEELLQLTGPIDYKDLKQNFSEAWIHLLKFNITNPTLFKKVLSNLNFKVLPFLSEPCLLIDFFTDSYNSGGVTSVIALNGLFTLIQEHNLDYPDFFKKLYQLLDRNLLHVKFRSRFFRLLSKILSSTHLPEIILA
ncbi:hypothetical protein HDU92_008097 [Lobulomyces angularis]|nr:hypothetical protein HDU92_008097 [Lobulomyces angularis]